MPSHLHMQGIRFSPFAILLLLGTQAFAQDPGASIAPRLIGLASPANVLLQDFDVKDAGEKLEAQIRVVNPASASVISKGLISYCTIKDGSNNPGNSAGITNETQCYERYVLDSEFEFPAVTPKVFTFAIPKPSVKGVTPSHVVLKFGNEFDARSFQASRNLPRSSPDVLVLPIHVESSGISNLARMRGTLYPPLMGISFEKDEFPEVTLFVTNRNPLPLDVVGKLQIRRRTEFGAVVYDGTTPSTKVPGSANSFRIKFTLPNTDLPPESYLASIQLYSADQSHIVSSIEDIRFINRGASATIQELSSKRAANGIVTTRFKIYGSADSGDRHRPGTTPAGQVNGLFVIVDKKTGNKLASIPISTPVNDLEGTVVSLTTPNAIEAEDLDIRVELVSQAVGPFSRSMHMNFPPLVKPSATNTASSVSGSAISWKGFAAIFAVLMFVIGFVAWSRKHGAA